jgi:release factor glutamine methyltransferase
MCPVESALKPYVARLAESMRLLPDKPDETAQATARALWHLAAGARLSLHGAWEKALPQLDAQGCQRLAALIEERVRGVPLAHLTGMQRFMGLDLLAGKEALIPRKETELLGQAALDHLRELAVTRQELLVIDVCTGSGNLAVAMAHYVARARVFASDLSHEAAMLAVRNARHVRVHDRVEVREGDLLAPFDEPRFHGAADLLLCNPPYISSAKVDAMPEEISKHEPRLAFDGGPFGVNLVIRLMRDGLRFLRKGGVLAFEVGLGQAPGLARRLATAGYGEVRSLADSAGEIRALIATR